MIKFKIIIFSIGTFCFLFSCENIKRKGLPKNVRWYGDVKTLDIDSGPLPSDALFKCENLSRKDLINYAIELSDSVLGKDFRKEIENSDVINSLNNQIFPSRINFFKGKLKIDKVIITSLEREKAYFNSDSLVPVKNFTKYFELTDDCKFEIEIEDYKVSLQIFVLPSMDYKKNGKVKYFEKQNSTTSIYFRHVYKVLNYFEINLRVTNTKTDETENYVKYLKDSSFMYSIMNLDEYHLLNQ